MKIANNKNGQRPQFVEYMFLNARNGRFTDSTRVHTDQIDANDHLGACGSHLNPVQNRIFQFWQGAAVGPVGLSKASLRRDFHEICKQ